MIKTKSLYSSNTSNTKPFIEDFVSFLSYINFSFTPYPKQVDMVKFAFNFNNRVKVILARREIGKTDLITIAGVLWQLYLNPMSTFTIITSKNTRSNQLINTIKNFMLRFPELYHIDQASTTKINLKENRFTKENSVEGVGLQTLLRGIHPTAVIFDDPLTMENAESQAIRELVKRKFDESLKLTKNIIIVGQPSHEQDLYQYFRENEEELSEVDRLEIWNDDLPEMKVDLDAERARGSSERAVQANYLGNLILDDNFPFHNIKILDDYEDFIPDIAVIDPAFSGKDEIGIALLQVIGNNEQFIFKAKGIKGNILNNDLSNQLIESILKYNSRCNIFVESNDNGGAFMAIANSNKKANIFHFKNIGNKEDRIVKTIAGVYNRIKLTADSDLRKVRMFNPSQRNQLDDVPDAIASAIYCYFNEISIINKNIESLNAF